VKRFIASALIVLMFSELALAQAQSEPAKTDWNAVLALKRGASLRVDLKDGTSMNGKFDAPSADKLQLLRDKAAIDVDRKDVSKVYRTQGSIGKSMAFGTLIGAGSGAICGLATDGEGWFTRGEAAAIGAIAGSAIGAGVGLLVGALRKKKVVVYETR
jgi:hypothetical protein